MGLFITTAHQQNSQNYDGSKCHEQPNPHLRFFCNQDGGHIAVEVFKRKASSFERSARLEFGHLNIILFCPVYQFLKILFRPICTHCYLGSILQGHDFIRLVEEIVIICGKVAIFLDDLVLLFDIINKHNAVLALNFPIVQGVGKRLSKVCQCGIRIHYQIGIDDA